MSSAWRCLPIRLPLLPGEALDSWLGAIVAGLDCPFRDVLRTLGLPNRDSAVTAFVLPRWTNLARQDELAAIAETTDVAEDMLVAMALQSLDGRAVAIPPEQRRVHRRVLWGRSGSWFCLACLAETGGRWQLAWRLGWSFVCTRHHLLPAVRCPVCRRIPRLRSHSRSQTSRPGRCSSPAATGGPRPPRCHRSLAGTPVTGITAGGPLEEAQQLISTALAAPGRMVGWLL
ncbi:TniQ family protein [Streptomyces sp. NPDC002809]|uniref:TniQ family protein n=1 Tax=Streptomyces sp. NPDC002809 TaxID=3154433 RepID=UPI00331D3F7F